MHLGHSANCSSVGSVVDVLFVSAALGASFASVVAASLFRKGRAEQSDAVEDESRVDEEPASPDTPPEEQERA